MDLSKIAKKKRDRVEDPLRLSEQLLDKLEECRTRLDAAIKVWPETKRTLQPALDKQNAIVQELEELHRKLAELWKQGAAAKWK